MSTRRIVTSFAVLVVGFACGEAATAPGVVAVDALASARAYLPGEQQPIIDTLAGAAAIYPTGAGQNLQQTFTPSDNGWLGYIEIPVGCADGVLLNVKIRAGLNGPILYEANVFGLPPTVLNFQLIQVFDPAVTKNGIKLRKGHEYAFELAAFPGPTATETTCGMARGPAFNSYAGGRGYFQDPINGPTYLPIPNGAPTDDQDLPFRTLVR